MASSPIAIGRLVPWIATLPSALPRPGSSPVAIAAAIHAGKNRSVTDSRPTTLPSSAGRRWVPGDWPFICSQPFSPLNGAGLLPGRDVAGLLAQSAADGAGGRLDRDGAVDRHRAGQPSRRYLRVAQADAGAAVGADRDGFLSAPVCGAVKAVHRFLTFPGDQAQGLRSCAAPRARSAT